MANVRDIAKQAGVSISTVSRVLNNNPRVSDQARDRVLAAMNRTRYVPEVGRKSTSNIALLYTDQPSIGSPFDAALMQGISRRMWANGYDLMVLDAQKSKRPDETYSQMFMRKGVRGVIVRTTTETRDICREIAEQGFPTVVIAEVFEQPNIQSVEIDARPACRQAMDHLIHLGHRRIAITLNIVNDYDHQQRLAVYRQSLHDAGIEWDDRLVLRVPAYRDAGAVTLRQLMNMPDRPTAVFMADPLAAVGLMHEAQRARVDIPGELSIVGFDDTDQRFGVYPRMTAVCQDAESIGRRAMALLSRMLSDTTTGDDRDLANLECWLEVHESTAPPGQAGGH